MGRKARDKKTRPVLWPASPVQAGAETPDTPEKALEPAPGKPGEPGTSMPPARSALWAVALLAATFTAFLGALDTPFLLDDPINITKNPQIKLPLDLAALAADPRAFVTASLRCNYLIGGFAVTGYHVFNVLAHAATGWLVFALSWKTLRLPAFEGRYARSAEALAAVIALVFLLHPMQTESVTYVIQRAEIFVSAALVAALLGLLAIEHVPLAAPALRPGRLTIGERFRNVMPLSMLAAACVLGVYSKPSFAVVPVLLVVYDVCFLSRGWRGQWRGQWRGTWRGRWRGTWRETWSGRWRERWRASRLGQPHAPGRPVSARAPAYTLAVAAALVTFALTSRSGSFEANTAGFDIEGITPLGYLSAQFGVIVHYLRVALWPNDLCFDCGYRGPWPVLGTMLGDSVVLPAAILAALGASAIAAWKRHPLVTFAVFASAVVLSPTSSFVPLADFYVEHRMYLPIAFLAMALVPAAHDAIGALASRLPVAATTVAVVRSAVAVAVLASLAITTASRNELLADPIALMEDALAKAPQNERVHYNLANAYKRLGRLDDAIPHYEAAIRLLPNVVRSYQNLGSLYLEQGKLEDALRVFEAGARAKPDAAMAHRNVGNTYLRLGRAGDALASATRAIEVDPTHPNGHRLKGDALLELGRAAEAAEAYRAGLAVSPRDATLKDRLAKLEGR